MSNENILKRVVIPRDIRRIKWKRGLLCGMIVIITGAIIIFIIPHKTWAIIVTALIGLILTLICWVYLSLMIPKNWERLEKLMIDIYDKLQETE